MYIAFCLFCFHTFYFVAIAFLPCICTISYETIYLVLVPCVVKFCMPVPEEYCSTSARVRKYAVFVFCFVPLQKHRLRAIVYLRLKRMSLFGWRWVLASSVTTVVGR